MLPRAARAQMMGRPGTPGSGMSVQGLEQAGPGSLKNSGKSADEAIREAKRKYADADPRVRVRVSSRCASSTVWTPTRSFRGISDPDVRVRIKAIDVLGGAWRFRRRTDHVAGTVPA